jgi:hypothetical protein
MFSGLGSELPRTRTNHNPRHSLSKTLGISWNAGFAAGLNINKDLKYKPRSGVSFERWLMANIHGSS